MRTLALLVLLLVLLLPALARGFDDCALMELRMREMEEAIHALQCELARYVVRGNPHGMFKFAYEPLTSMQKEMEETYTRNRGSDCAIM